MYNLVNIYCSIKSPPYVSCCQLCIQEFLGFEDGCKKFLLYWLKELRQICVFFQAEENLMYFLCNLCMIAVHLRTSGICPEKHAAHSEVVWITLACFLHFLPLHILINPFMLHEHEENHIWFKFDDISTCKKLCRVCSQAVVWQCWFFFFPCFSIILSVFTWTGKKMHVIDILLTLRSARRF
jgi:hypothetical protein